MQFSVDKKSLKFIITLEPCIDVDKLGSLQFWNVLFLNHKSLFHINKTDSLVKPQVASWRLLLIGAIYQHTPVNSDKYMLFSLFLITTIYNDEEYIFKFTYKGRRMKRECGHLGIVSVIQ